DSTGHSGSWLSRNRSSITLPNLTPRSGSSSGIVRGGRISEGKKDHGGGGGAEATSVMYASIAPWDQVHTLENVVPALTTVGQPPRKDPQMEYSKIVPQSEQKYR
ncbi:hypothetical protein Tco_0239092, partial [Tanacetum coccineum]